jgi:hypothetical protein
MANEEKIENGKSDEELEKEIMESAEAKNEEEVKDDTENMEEAKKSDDKKAKAEKHEEEYEDEEEEDTDESKKSKKEEFPHKDEDEEDEEETDENKKAKTKKEDIEVDVSADVSALVDGEELSEEFKTKAATIFEAAVKSKIAGIRKQIREESKKENDERIESMQTEMTENVDNYLNYTVKEWMTENKLAVETGVRNEVTESFISGLKKLFEEHYIDVPVEKEDVFENLVVEVAELEEKLDEQTEKHMEIVKELNKYKADHIFKEISEGMVDTDVEKLAELTEDVEYDTDEQYKEKLNIIKNSYFKSDKKEVKDNKKTAGTNNPVADGKSDERMDSIMSAISNLSKKGIN